VTRSQRYLTAVGFLRDAERLSLPDDRRPEWAFAAGISLHSERASRTKPSRSWRRRCGRTPPGKHEAGLIVTQIYMDGPNTRKTSSRRMALNDQPRRRRTLRPDDRDNAGCKRPDLLGSGTAAGSEEALEKVSRGQHAAPGNRRIGQPMMVEASSRGVKTLDPLARDSGARSSIQRGPVRWRLRRTTVGASENAVVLPGTAERFRASARGPGGPLSDRPRACEIAGPHAEALENYA